MQVSSQALQIALVKLEMFLVVYHHAALACFSVNPSPGAENERTFFHHPFHLQEAPRAAASCREGLGRSQQQEIR